MSIDRNRVQYAQIEKELLPVVIGLEKFNHYVCGKCVDAVTIYMYRYVNACGQLVVPWTIYNKIAHGILIGKM